MDYIEYLLATKSNKTINGWIEINKCCRRIRIKWVRECSTAQDSRSLLLLFGIEDEHCKIYGHAQIRMQNLTITSTLLCAHCTYPSVFESDIKAIHLFHPIQYDSGFPKPQDWNEDLLALWRFCDGNHEYFSLYFFLLNQLWIIWRRCLETVETKNLRIMIRAERMCKDKFESLWLGIRWRWSDETIICTYSFRWFYNIEDSRR